MNFLSHTMAKENYILAIYCRRFRALHFSLIMHEGEDQPPLDGYRSHRRHARPRRQTAQKTTFARNPTSLKPSTV
jgi:hypothetical protein